MKHLHLLLLLILLSALSYASKTDAAVEKVLNKTEIIQKAHCTVTVTITDDAVYYCDATGTLTSVTCEITKTAINPSCTTATNSATNAANLEMRGCITLGLAHLMIECDNTPPPQ